MDVRVLMWTTFIMTIIMTCTHTLFLPALFSLFVMGIIPGTTYEIPACFMLLVYPTLFIAALYLIGSAQPFIGEPTQPERLAVKKPEPKVVRRASSKPTTVKRRARLTA